MRNIWGRTAQAQRPSGTRYPLGGRAPPVRLHERSASAWRACHADAEAMAGMYRAFANGTVDKMPPPGAPMSTVFAPQWLWLHSSPAAFVAATTTA
ncbi:hypothetical protein C1879_00200 [Paraeggerthella hongkongensis]|uniref:hypothetical protein n=1 Tax=Paraeggerthella sp. TaxID=2897350 RepID=UPI000E14B7C3|nr:hypothetical protein C1879_00200 [Paraeggerthella hongkongensis]